MGNSIYFITVSYRCFCFTFINSYYKTRLHKIFHICTDDTVYKERINVSMIIIRILIWEILGTHKHYNEK